MGIDLSIRKLLISRNATAFTLTPPFGANGDPTRYVVIDDVLTRFMSLRGHTDYMFTGLQIFQAFMGPILDHQQSGAAAYVAICDDFLNVPHQKAATQAARSASRSDVKPYDDGVHYLITSQGLMRVDDATAPPELIDIRRLMRTRPLRVKLWQYINQRLAELENDQFSNDFRIVFEYQRGSVNLYPEDAAWPTEFYLPHNHGEADMSIVYWAKLYRDTPILVTTIDTDTIPITLNYLQRTGREAPLYWTYEGTLISEKRQRIFVDMVQLHDRECSTRPASVFALGCIMAGNDFFTKKDVAHLFNPESILRACGTAYERGFIDNRWRNARSAMTAVLGVLAFLYGQGCNYLMLPMMKPDDVMHHWIKIKANAIHQNPRLLPPSDEVLKASIVRIAWCMVYWKCKLEV